MPCRLYCIAFQDLNGQGVGIADKREVAVKLAHLHYNVEDGLEKVYLLRGPAETDADPIKLLEVNRSTVSAGIMPLGFDPAPTRGISYASVIVEVTPEEFQRIQSGDLSLPHGWEIAEEILDDKTVAAP